MALAAAREADPAAVLNSSDTMKPIVGYGRSLSTARRLAPQPVVEYERGAGVHPVMSTRSTKTAATIAQSAK